MKIKVLAIRHANSEFNHVMEMHNFKMTGNMREPEWVDEDHEAKFDI